MYLDEDLKNELVARITEKAKVKSIILFGSYAYGKPDNNSDIDLIAILDEEGISKSFREKMQRKNKITSVLIDIMKRVPIDLLVYTKDEWKKLVSMNNSFVSEIAEKGVILK